jgi:hypothetical protein
MAEPYQDPSLPTNPTEEDFVGFSEPTLDIPAAQPVTVPGRESAGMTFDFDALFNKVRRDGFQSLDPAQQELLRNMKRGIAYPGESAAKFIEDYSTKLREQSSPKAQADLAIAENTLAKSESERAAAEREKQESLTRASNEYKRMTDLIEKLKTHPGRAFATGKSSMMPKMRGTAPYDFSILLDQVRGKQFLAGFQSIKGGGSITQPEGDKAQAAVARTDPGQSEPEFLAGLDDFKNFLTEEYNATLTRFGGAPQGNAPSQPATPPAERIIGGQLFRMNPQTGKYVPAR